MLELPKKPTETNLATNKPVLPEVDHRKGKISHKEVKSFKDVLFSRP